MYWCISKENVYVILQIQRNTISFATVNKQKSFLTYFCEIKDNFFHYKIIDMMGPTPFWKMLITSFWVDLVTVCLYRYWYFIFFFFLACKIRHGRKTSIQTCIVFNWVLGDKWVILIFLINVSSVISEGYWLVS